MSVDAVSKTSAYNVAAMPSEANQLAPACPVSLHHFVPQEAQMPTFSAVNEQNTLINCREIKYFDHYVPY